MYIASNNFRFLNVQPNDVSVTPLLYYMNVNFKSFKSSADFFFLVKFQINGKLETFGIITFIREMFDKNVKERKLNGDP